MSKQTKDKHMSKAKTKSDNLPPLQKQIVLNLAENQPQTINETVKAISKTYKASWIAFNSLEKKNLIEKTDVKKYRGREYPRYWLTSEGIVMALMEGASFDKLLEQTKILHPDAKILHCFLEIMAYIKPEVLEMAYSLVKGKKEPGINELSTLAFSANTMDYETAEEFKATLEKYPDEYNKFKTRIQAMINQLNQLIKE
jgi:hypothetical protein